jgi:hypothetical protein
MALYSYLDWENLQLAEEQQQFKKCICLATYIPICPIFRMPLFDNGKTDFHEILYFCRLTITILFNIRPKWRKLPGELHSFALISYVVSDEQKI